jgi:hypothetical protein
MAKPMSDERLKELEKNIPEGPAATTHLAEACGEIRRLWAEVERLKAQLKGADEALGHHEIVEKGLEEKNLRRYVERLVGGCSCQGQRIK